MVNRFIHLVIYPPLAQVFLSSMSAGLPAPNSGAIVMRSQDSALNCNGINDNENTFGGIDELNYTYNGNQLLSVQDNVLAQYQNNRL